MSRSWARSTLISSPTIQETPASEAGRFADGLLAWKERLAGAQLALLATRLAVHLALGLLLVVTIVGLAPTEIELPSIEPLLIPEGIGAEQVAFASEEQATTPGVPTTRHFLSTESVPLTVRILRQTLPLGEPKRIVRTTVLKYRVQPGDTVLGIAQKFGLKGSTLLWANDRLADNPDFLSVGQELNILPVDGALHVVRPGETVESIARRYKVDPTAITGYVGNGLKEPYTLKVGQELIIPEGIKPYVPRRVFAYNGEVPQNAKKGSGQFVWPMSGYITQRYWQGHRAIDIGAPKGTPVVASDSGYVAVAQWSDVGYGRMIIIDHGNGYQTLYAHLSAYVVDHGQSVGKGQLIGLCGSTGNSTGPHLHFEIIQNGTRRNPLGYLP